MGIVWLARDAKLERAVALKFLPELMVLDEQAVADLKRETKKSQELRHHHIVSVYDFVSDEQTACIAMEYVDGPTLSALKARKESNCLEIEELRPWITQLCEALSYAHEKAKVVHRDLKPANLMVNSKAELKVADFGIARSVSDSMSMLTQARGTSGTLAYMSPQQLNGEKASPLDDIYSLGATLYELTTGKPPFYGGDVTDQIKNKIAPLLTPRRRELDVSGAPIPAEWESTVAACLAKDPAQRPQSVEDVAERLSLEQRPRTKTKPAPRETTIADCACHSRTQGTRGSAPEKIPGSTNGDGDGGPGAAGNRRWLVLGIAQPQWRDQAGAAAASSAGQHAETRRSREPTRGCASPNRTGWSHRGSGRRKPKEPCDF